jgi:hypothetical protein
LAANNPAESHLKYKPWVSMLRLSRQLCEGNVCVSSNAYSAIIFAASTDKTVRSSVGKAVWAVLWLTSSKNDGQLATFHARKPY